MKEKKQHKDLHYPFRGFRIADETYERLKEKKEELETWNKFFVRLLNNSKK